MLLVYILPLIFNTILGLSLALVIIRNQSAPGARALTGLILGASLWSAGYAMEFLTTGLDTKLFWAKFQYFGIIVIPVTWFFFAILHMGPPAWLERYLKYLRLLWVIPIITLLMVWTNELHGLVWKSVDIMDIDSVQILELHHGIWFWIYWVFAYILLLLGTIGLVEGLLTSIRLYRWQIMLAVLASVMPWIGNLIYVSGMSPIEHLDLTPFAFAISTLLFTISMVGFQLTKLLPIAQKTVFGGMADCLVVLDLQDRIVDLNPAARKMFSKSDFQLGKLLDEVHPELAQWIEPAATNEEYRAEVSCGADPNIQYFEMVVSPLYGQFLPPLGRLIVCHDITQHKQQQANLEKARSELETIVSERTEMLKETVEQLQHELTQRNLAERRFEDMVEAAPDAMVLIDQSGAIQLVNMQAETLLGYTREEVIGMDIGMLVPEEQRSKRREQIMQYAANSDDWQLKSDRDIFGLQKDGSQFPVEISLGPLDTAEGRWVICHIRDISSRKQAEQEEKRLLEEIRASREQLRALTYRMQEVQEFERRQIATELHDRVGQNLTGINLHLQVIQNQLDKISNPDLHDRLNDALELVEETTRQVRDVMADLRPMMLDEYGLLSAVNWYSGRFSQLTGISTDVIGNEFDPRLPPEDELVLFRILQEALNNVVKHAYANKVLIKFESNPQMERISVQDNGLGFDPDPAEASSNQPHWGLLTIAERASSIGWQLEIETAPGAGTLLAVTHARQQDEN